MLTDLPGASPNFLTENPARAGKLAKHLKKISDRNSLHVYSAKERLADFQEIFGDVARVEVDLVRSLERLQVNEFRIIVTGDP